ncbi:MAG: hypothetical protein GWN58_58290, partial [Anaerolineae bacterium]|nr:hypothetical protein [Anaerolineae bacterium]
MTRCLLALVALLLAASPGPAEQPEAAYILAGKVLEVRGGGLLEDQVIVLRGERIERV